MIENESLNEGRVFLDLPNDLLRLIYIALLNTQDFTSDKENNLSLDGIFGFLSLMKTSKKLHRIGHDLLRILQEGAYSLQPIPKPMDYSLLFSEPKLITNEASPHSETTKNFLSSLQVKLNQDLNNLLSIVDKN